MKKYSLLIILFFITSLPNLGAVWAASSMQTIRPREPAPPPSSVVETKRREGNLPKFSSNIIHAYNDFDHALFRYLNDQTSINEAALIFQAGKLGKAIADYKGQINQMINSLIKIENDITYQLQTDFYRIQLPRQQQAVLITKIQQLLNQ